MVLLVGMPSTGTGSGVNITKLLHHCVGLRHTSLPGLRHRRDVLADSRRDIPTGYPVVLLAGKFSTATGSDGNNVQPLYLYARLRVGQCQPGVSVVRGRWAAVRSGPYRPLGSAYFPIIGMSLGSLTPFPPPTPPLSLPNIRSPTTSNIPITSQYLHPNYFPTTGYISSTHLISSTGAVG